MAFDGCTTGLFLFLSNLFQQDRTRRSKKNLDKSNKIISITAEPRDTEKTRTVEFTLETTTDGVTKPRAVQVPQIDKTTIPSNSSTSSRSLRKPASIKI